MATAAIALALFGVKSERAYAFFFSIRQRLLLAPTDELYIFMSHRQPGDSLAIREDLYTPIDLNSGVARFLGPLGTPFELKTQGALALFAYFAVLHPYYEDAMTKMI